MRIIPEALEKLTEELRNLPGVGPRTAERYAYHILKSSEIEASKLSSTIEKIHRSIGYCEKTFALVEKGKKLSDLYTDPERDKQQVVVVAEPFDIISIEKTRAFRGTYHVLGGLISPIDNINPDDLKIQELIVRIDEDKVKEIIFATSASVEGESTALYIQKQLGDRKVKITRLARGLPVGIDIEYADQMTLGRALEGRTLL